MFPSEVPIGQKLLHNLSEFLSVPSNYAKLPIKFESLTQMHNNAHTMRLIMRAPYVCMSHERVHTKGLCAQLCNVTPPNAFKHSLQN